MSSHLAHYLTFLLIIFFVCPITVFLMSFTSTIHYVVLLISNKNLPLKKNFKNCLLFFDSLFYGVWRHCLRPIPEVQQ